MYKTDGGGRPRVVTDCGIEALEGRVLLAAVPTGFKDATYVSGLSNPTSMAFAPDGRLFVTQQAGQLRVVTRGANGVATASATPFLSVATDSNGERGLLGVEFDPNFPSNGYVYVYYTVPGAAGASPHNRVSRFTAVDADPDPAAYHPGNTAAAGSEKVLLDLNPLSSATNHNGGALHFGADGKLYIDVGENANGANSQTLGNLLGKILRINSDGTIPTDNPFYNQAAGNNRAIWALGLRNPFTFAVQPGTGRIFINDVGQSTWEEIDEGVAGSNYGWPNIEGFRTTQPLPTIGTYRDPLFVYDHSNGQTAITGGTFYNPSLDNFPAQYVGRYFFADLGAGWIHYVDPAVARPTVNTFATGVSSPVDLDVGPDGGLYYLARGTNSVGRIEGTAVQAPRVQAQPQNVTVDAGSPATFSAFAFGDPTLVYQWQRAAPGGAFADITGATGASYTLPSTTATDQGARFRVVVTNGSGSAPSNEAVLTVNVPAPAVVGRAVFYNNSAFDGFDPAAGPSDDAAIATDKAALLPGQTATFSNVTSYSKGINGVMVDVKVADPAATPISFSYAVGRGSPVTWGDAPSPSQVPARPGAGSGGSDRYEITFPDRSIRNAWLQVIVSVPEGDHVRLLDTFYVGNLVGETGNDPTALRVNAFDLLATRSHRAFTGVTVANSFDFNRDGRVNAIDLATVRANRGHSIDLLPAPSSPAVAQARVRSVRRAVLDPL